MTASKPKLSLNRETLKHLASGDNVEPKGQINTYDCSAVCSEPTREAPQIQAGTN